MGGGHAMRIFSFSGFYENRFLLAFLAISMVWPHIATA
jgi:hypothetical protein